MKITITRADDYKRGKRKREENVRFRGKINKSLYWLLIHPFIHAKQE